MFMNHPLFSPDENTSSAPTPPPPGSGGEETRRVPDDNSIRLTRAEYDQLREQANKVPELQRLTGELEKDWKAAERLVKRDPDADPAELERATRHVMAKAGYSASEIEEYLAEEATPPTQRSRTRDDEDEDDGVIQEVSQIRGQLTNLQKKQADSEYRQLKEDLDNSIISQLDRNKDLVTLVSGLVKHNTDEDSDPSAVEKYRNELRDQLSSEIHRETTERLRERRQIAGGHFDAGWIREESVKAAAAVNARYRKMVGDPSRLGRAPETMLGQDRFVNSKPVPPPSHKKGTNFADAQTAVRSWAADMLTRSIAEDSTDGSRV